MNAMSLLRAKNKMLGALLPELVAKQCARLFLTPRRFEAKAWEQEAEQAGERLTFGAGLSAIRWGTGNQRILLMHGWESRATQMYGIASVLAKQGFEVIAIDAPMHGKSGGNRSNPVVFAETVAEADVAFGPFHGAVGHSMGAAALAIACGSGVSLGRHVLISSPAVVHDTLWAFAKFVGLSDHCARRFVHHVEMDVGCPSKDLDVSRLLGNYESPSLLVHSKDDREVPFQSALIIQSALSRSELYSPEGLGHRKIVRDAGVAKVIQRFLAEDSVQRSKTVRQSADSRL